MQQIDYLDERLRRALQTRLQHIRAHLKARCVALAQCSPAAMLQRHRQKHDYLTDRLCRGMTRLIQLRSERLGASSQMLNSVSPLQTVARGYAIVTDGTGAVVRDSTQVQTGDTITARLARGELTCEVIRTRPPGDDL